MEGVIHRTHHGHPGGIHFMKTAAGKAIVEKGPDIPMKTDITVLSGKENNDPGGVEFTGPAAAIPVRLTPETGPDLRYGFFLYCFFPGGNLKFFKVI